MKISKILIIIRRSNGDIFLSSPLINSLYEYYNHPQIDLLVNDDTYAIAKTLNNINNIFLFSYKRKKENSISQEINIIKSIYKKYDLSINLTANDRSVLYCILASSYSISAIEKDLAKSWWKKILLKKNYIFNTNKHIIKNNTESLRLLKIDNKKISISSTYSKIAKNVIINKLKKLNIDKFMIFHPSAQYDYKIYPKKLRDDLLKLLNSLNTPIIITGSKSKIDLKIKKELPILENIYDFIGKTSLDELIALSDLSICYIGMDTLNMHIASSQNKPIFAIFGPTILSMWSPWSNELQTNAIENKKMQTYGDITIFQANMSCVACGLAGCDDKHGQSDCLYQIEPKTLFRRIKNWLETLA